MCLPICFFATGQKKAHGWKHDFRIEICDTFSQANLYNIIQQFLTGSVWVVPTQQEMTLYNIIQIFILQISAHRIWTGYISDLGVNVEWHKRPRGSWRQKGLHSDRGRLCQCRWTHFGHWNWNREVGVGGAAGVRDPGRQSQPPSSRRCAAGGGARGLQRRRSALRLRRRMPKMRVGGTTEPGSEPWCG